MDQLGEGMANFLGNFCRIRVMTTTITVHYNFDKLQEYFQPFLNQNATCLLNKGL